MSKGARWRAEVKAALAASHRQQRQRRGKRSADASAQRIGPGMVRLPAKGGAGGQDPAAKGAVFGLTPDQAAALAAALATARRAADGSDGMAMVNGW
jgi:hypothetical protein